MNGQLDVTRLSLILGAHLRDEYGASFASKRLLGFSEVEGVHGPLIVCEVELALYPAGYMDRWQNLFRMFPEKQRTTALLSRAMYDHPERWMSTAHLEL